MKIRVYIQGQYIPHEYECIKWTTYDNVLCIYGGEDNRVIAQYNSCDWNIVKEVEE